MAKKRKSSKPKKLSKTSLLATPTDLSVPVEVGFRFVSGIGQATASLFRKGLLINMQSISSSGNIHFSEVQSRDVISINGVCTGTADISVSVPTRPETPEHFDSGIILTGYLIN